MTDQITAVLVINRTDSLCTYCGKGCLPEETHHYTLAGYGLSGQSGCGARFIAVGTNYYGMDDSVQEMRPDLPFMDWKARNSSGNI